MKEEILREIARNWLDEQYVHWKKYMNFEIFHGKGPLTNHLRRKFQGLDLTSIPNYDSASIEPDIAGITSRGFYYGFT